MCVFQRNNQELNSETVDPNNMSKSRNNADAAGLSSRSDKNGPITLDNLKFDVKVSDLKDLMQLKGNFVIIKYFNK